MDVLVEAHQPRLVAAQLHGSVVDIGGDEVQEEPIGQVKWPVVKIYSRHALQKAQGEYDM